jgi:hypothetical protein
MSNFVELSDRTIVNIDDIILLNVDKMGGNYIYKLFLRGKGMTLRLSEADYNIIRNKTVVGENG